MKNQYICARCGCSLVGLHCTGMSSIYNPGGDIELCEPCYFSEDAEITEAGTNNLPTTLTTYKRRLAAAGVA